MNPSSSNPEPTPARLASSDTPPAGIPTQQMGEYYAPHTGTQPSPASYNLPQPQATLSSSTPSQRLGNLSRRQMGPPLAGPVILIGVGILLLLNNLGVLPWAVWSDIWRLWPLALIAVGLDLVIGRRKPLISLLIILLVIGVGGFAVMYAGFATRGELTSFNLNVPSSNAQSAEIEIDFGTGELHVDTSANSENLASGTLDYYSNRRPPKADLDMDEQRADLNISAGDDQSNFDWFGPSKTLNWNIHLNPRVPTYIKADLGVGNSTLNLGGMNLTRLNIDSGTGNTTIVFPKPTGKVEARIDGGVGNLTLTIPQGTEARLSVDTGVGNVTVDPRFTKQGEDTWITSNYASSQNRLELSIDAGVGNITITP